MGLVARGKRLSKSWGQICLGGNRCKQSDGLAGRRFLGITPEI